MTEVQDSPSESTDGAAEQLSGAFGVDEGFAEPRDLASRLRDGLTPLLASSLVVCVAALTTLGWAGVSYVSAGATEVRAVAAERAVLRETWPTPAPAVTATPTPAPSATVKAAVTSNVSRPRNNTLSGSVVAPASAIGMMYIPAIGLTTPIMGGVDVGSLAKGVGWFPGTSLPGQSGNFPVAGHSVTHTEPFKYLQRVQPGDLVYVDYQGVRYTYQMETSPASLWVTDSEACVVYSTPCRYTGSHTSLITLITCALYVHTNQRAVGFGYLIGSAPIS